MYSFSLASPFLRSQAYIHFKTAYVFGAKPVFSFPPVTQQDLQLLTQVNLIHPFYCGEGNFVSLKKDDQDVALFDCGHSLFYGLSKHTEKS